MIEYKGINLTKINGIQKVNFPKSEYNPQLDVLKIEGLNTEIFRIGIENHARRLAEDTEMAIICEMAKLFLEEKEKWKRAVERLEGAKAFEGDWDDEMSCGAYNAYNYAITVVKEEGGMNE